MLIWTDSPKHPSGSFLFLDRDGVINRDSPDYIKCWAEMTFYPDALDALRWLREHAIGVVLISNQSGLGRGIIQWAHFWEMHERMVGAIRDAGGDLMAAFFCPHRPDEGCSCRKPAPGMLLTASRLFSIPLERCFMVGDNVKDVEAMATAGGRGVLLEREPSRRVSDGDRFSHPPYPVHADLMEAITAMPWSEMLATGVRGSVSREKAPPFAQGVGSAFERKHPRRKP